MKGSEYCEGVGGVALEAEEVKCWSMVSEA